MPVFGYYSCASLLQWYLEGKKWYGQAGYARKAKSWSNPTLDGLDLRGQVYLVTGANAGIGYAATRQLLSRGASVHMLCRNGPRGQAAQAELFRSTLVAPDQLVLHLVDVSDFAQVRAFATTFATTNLTLDGVVHNAGVLMKTESQNAAGDEVTVATMLGGTQVLVSLMLPLLLENPRGGRIVNVTSAGQYNVGLETSDLNGQKRSGKKYDGTLAYAIVKRQQMALTEHWAHVLRDSNVLVHAMHPGWSESPGLKRSMPDFHAQNKSMFRSADEGADTITYLLASPVAELGTKNGLLWFDREPVRKHMPLACTTYSLSERTKLWENVNKMCDTTLEIQKLEEDMQAKKNTTTTAPNDVKVST